MINLSDGDKWLKIHDESYVAQPIPDKAEQYFPIVPVIIPIPLDYYTVAIHSSISNAKESWRFGGKAYSVFDIPGTEIVIGKLGRGYYVELNFPTIIQTVKAALRYRIAFYFPKWFTNVRLEVWVHTSNEPLRTVENRLINIENQLDRIETKLDNNQLQTSVNTGFDDSGSSGSLGII